MNDPVVNFKRLLLIAATACSAGYSSHAIAQLKPCKPHDLQTFALSDDGSTVHIREAGQGMARLETPIVMAEECQDGVPSGAVRITQSASVQMRSNFVWTWAHSGYAVGGTFLGLVKVQATGAMVWSKKMYCVDSSTCFASIDRFRLHLLGADDSTPMKYAFDDPTSGERARDSLDAEKLSIARKKRETSEADERRASHATRFMGLVSASKCEEAKSLYSRIIESDRPPYSHEDCVDQRSYNAVKSSNDAQSVYVAAAKYQSDGYSSRATVLYRLVIDKFPKHPLAIRAADRLAGLAEVAATDAAIRRGAEAAESLQRQQNANRDQDTRRRSEEKSNESINCSVRIGRCTDSCTRLSGAAWRSCTARCESICSR